MKIIEYVELASTNDEAKRLCQENTVVTAVSQTNGRGRRGRSWQSLKGNLFFSVILKNVAVEKAVFASSLSVAEAVSFFSLSAAVKWPNDVLVNGKKVSGILAEKEGDYLIIGIGVNIKESPVDSTVLYSVTSLKEEGIETTRTDFLKLFLNIFERNLAEDFEDIRKKWLFLAIGLGSEIKVMIENNVIEGIFKTIDSRGFLLLETGNGIKNIAAGDVFLKG